MKTKYSNLRTIAEFDNWPNGPVKTRCSFKVERNPKLGERVVRITINPKTGRPNAPRRDTYAKFARIADGDDGRTYVVRFVGTHFSVMQSGMQFQHEVIFPGEDGYNELSGLMREALAR